jgi:hypothetical protein
MYGGIDIDFRSVLHAELRGPDLWVLSSDTGVECFTLTHGMWLTFLGIPSLVVFCGLLPLGAFYKIKRLKMCVHASEQHPTIILVCCFVW